MKKKKENGDSNEKEKKNGKTLLEKQSTPGLTKRNTLLSDSSCVTFEKSHF